MIWSRFGAFLVWCSVFFSSRRRHTRYWRDWSSDVCSSDLVVELQEREVRLSHEKVLVVAVISAQRKAPGAAWEIIAEVPSDIAKRHTDVLADEELGAVLARVLRVSGIKMRTSIWPQTIHGVEIQAGCSEVLDSERVLFLLGKGCQIQRNVMIDE